MIQWSVEAVEYAGKVIDDLRRDGIIPADWDAILEYAEGVYEYWAEDEGYDDVPAPGIIAACAAEMLRKTGELAPTDQERDFVMEILLGKISTEKPPLKGWRAEEEERGAGRW